MSSDSLSENCDWEGVENLPKEADNIENQSDIPQKGMKFNSIEELHEYYSTYAKYNGFAVSKRNVKKRKRWGEEIHKNCLHSCS